MQQSFYDLITRESEKLRNLNNMLSVCKDYSKKENNIQYRQDQDKIAAENERKEKMRFEEELEREVQEKKSLLQAIINESAESGTPLPPSLIKLLHSNSGKNKK